MKSEPKFSHGICPKCMEEHFPEDVNIKKNVSSTERV